MDGGGDHLARGVAQPNFIQQQVFLFLLFCFFAVISPVSEECVYNQNIHLRLTLISQG